MGKTLIIINPHAAGGRAGALWHDIEPMLHSKLGDLTVAITQHPQDVPEQLEKAHANGTERVLSIGGDGTNHALVNAIAMLRQNHPGGDHMVYGILPVGTGRDWARNMGIPMDVHAAADWILNATPTPTDVGVLTMDNGQQEHFLNIASVGISGEVARRVNTAKRRYRWTFLAATIGAILTYKATNLRLWLDHELHYEGPSLTVVVANGTTFGHGMKIAPNARIDDGLFDVVLARTASKIDTLGTLRKVYDGSHLTHPMISVKQAAHIRIESDAPLPVDMDGENALSRTLTFEVKPRMIRLLRLS